MTIATLPRKKDGTPATKTVADALDYWAERIVQPKLAAANPRERIQHRDGSIYAIGDKLFHYGSHFEVARILRSANGAARLVLLNGDVWSGGSGWGGSTSTSSVQRSARDAVARTNVPGITVPFSALTAAGITFESIKPIEVRDDRDETIHRESATQPGKLVMMDDPTGATYVDQQQRYGFCIDGVPCDDPHRTRSNEAKWGPYLAAVTVPVKMENPNECEAPSEMHAWSTGPAKLDDDGVWRWTVKRHWLGDALYRAKVTEQRTRKATDAEIATLVAANEWETTYKRLQNALSALTDERSAAQNGKYDWDRRLRMNVKLSDPKPELIPEIEVRLEAARAAYHAHCEQPAPRSACDKQHRVHFTINRWAMFLSSFDYAEPHRPYFMCEMPYGCKASTVEEAILALKPETVANYEAVGCEVLRQGDVFAIPFDLTTNELELRAKTWYRDHTVFPLTGDSYKVCDVETIHKYRRGDKGARVLGTSHAATHVIHTKDGATFMRGSLYHAPTGWGRTADHRVVKLGDGKTWYLAVKNTVPLDKASGSSRGSISATQRTANRSGNSRAWTITGAVD